MSETVRRDVVGIGASAGGVEALLRLLPSLPANTPAAIAVVLHRHPTAVSKLVEIFSRRSRMPVVEPADGDPFLAGTIFLAPRDVHMTIVHAHVRLDRGPKQHHTRPAIDPLFRSLGTYGRRAVGVILTGTMTDGVGGLIALKQHGGVSIVQDPREALFGEMPMRALMEDHVDRVLSLEEIGRAIALMASGPIDIDSLPGSPVAPRS